MTNTKFQILQNTNNSLVKSVSTKLLKPIEIEK